MNIPDLLIVCPSRQRPHAVAQLAQALADTCTANTHVLWCIDDLNELEAYDRAVRQARFTTFRRMRLVASEAHLGFIGCLNRFGVGFLAAEPDVYALASLGDDHRPDTVGWDSAYLTELRRLGTGIVYGDDGHQGAALPTQMAMTADIVAALGYVAPPTLWHMYCDNYWKDLGEGAGCLSYLPDVVVTHHHPGTGKGTWDASYRESNSTGRYAQDEAAYREFVRSGALAADIATVTALRGER